MSETSITTSDSTTGTAPRKRGRPSSLVEQMRECQQCHGSFTTKLRADGSVAKGFPTTYCSRACSRQVANARAAEQVRAEYEANPRRCPCGKPFPYEVRNHLKSYCSPECRATYGKKRQRDETKWTTKTCLNCGVEFELRTSSQSWGKYCSNACAMRHTKTKQHLVLKDSDTLLDSSYEALVWAALTVAKIPVERFDRQHGVEWGEGRWYAPDLWLSGQQIAVECKGLQDDEDAARWDAYRSTGVRLAVLDRVDLMTMSPTTALAIVENAAH